VSGSERTYIRGKESANGGQNLKKSMKIVKKSYSLIISNVKFLSDSLHLGLYSLMTTSVSI
ncbi:unnamed protein product, partial [Brassica rapa subsp. trilocularis]